LLDHVQMIDHPVSPTYAKGRADLFLHFDFLSQGACHGRNAD
jgi:hypothetical protein